MQRLPVNDLVNDVFFLDSLNGWLVTQGDNDPVDTSYIMRTTNGGDNWTIQMRQAQNLNVVQFLDINTGYAAGGTGSGFARIYKTTVGGLQWQLVPSTGMALINDMFFVNKDTGWVCDPSVIFGGLHKTTNGGISWKQQLDVSYKIQKIFFLNKDTGWAGSRDVNGILYKTTNGGLNWNVQYISNYQIESLFFINPRQGWIRGGTGNGVVYTIDGGNTWTSSIGNIATGFDTKFITDSLGYSGTFSSLRIMKSTDGGKTWGYQNTPQLSGNVVAVIKGDTNKVWAGSLMHTTDGGGVIVGISKPQNELPKNFLLYQNYPNPFNPKTIINYEIGYTSNVKLEVYDISGRMIKQLVNQKQNPGKYYYTFDGSDLPSAVYFYKLTTEDFTETKKMVLAK
ncbi:MAG: T9SS type A sorting domain-containing protein [Ignavibacteria bacterium]|nr:T9SS type A sorting domain-containing protein [Ignavibacteria bacterium]